jgi:aryl-alcohol dehydrogenase-like predicted oxidoreductase
LLLHHSAQLLGPQGRALDYALTAIKEEGLVEKVGVSIYSPDELDLLGPHFKFDLVQAPFNVLDRRLATSGWLTRLSQAGTEVHLRSIFLQGLLLMEASSRPATFNRWRTLWDSWHGWLAHQHVTPLQACVSLALAQPAVSRIVVGVDSVVQLQQILAGVDATVAMPPAALVSEDLDLIIPSRWQQ